MYAIRSYYDRTAGPILIGGQVAVSTLPAVLPVWYVLSRNRDVPRETHAKKVSPRFFHAPLAVVRARIFAPLTNP